MSQFTSIATVAATPAVQGLRRAVRTKTGTKPFLIIAVEPLDRIENSVKLDANRWIFWPIGGH